MKVAVLCSLVLLGSFPAVASAQHSAPQPLIRTSLSEAVAPFEDAVIPGKTDDESWFVEARGSGETSVLARDEAVREALRSTMGALITAETILEDEEVIEKIVSYTDGFLEDYVVLEEEERDELWHVLIMAQVRPGKLQNTLNGVGVSTQLVKGRVLAARARFKISQRKSAGLMIRKALSDLKGTLDAKVTGEPTLGQTNAYSVELLVPVRLRVVPERYRSWCDRYIPWFEKLADKHTSASYPADIRKQRWSVERQLHEKACAGMDIQAPWYRATGSTLIVDNQDSTRFWVFHFDIEVNDFPSRSPYRSYRDFVVGAKGHQAILTAGKIPVWKLSFLAGGDGAEEVLAPVIVGKLGDSAMGPAIRVAWAAPFDSFRVCPAIPFGRWSFVCFDLKQTSRPQEQDLVVSVEMPLGALERFEKCSVSLCWPEWK